MPLNLNWFRPGGTDFPLGLALTFLVLLAIAIVNLFTKQVATIWGISFTAGLFIVFSISERINGAAPHEYGEEPEKFNLHIDRPGQPLDPAARNRRPCQEADRDPRPAQPRPSASLPERAR